MKHGDLRHTVTIQRPSTVQDTNGDNVTVWADLLTFKAAIDPLNVREQFMAAQEHASATHRIRGHYRAALAAADGSERIVFGSRIFPLIGRPTDVGTRHREIQFLVEEGLKES